MANKEAGMPVTTEILAWARKQSGFTVEEAQRLFPKYYEWEAGESLPSYPQLEAISDKFKIPIAVFFFPQPPEVPDIEQTFRTLANEDFEFVSPKIRLLLRKAMGMQLGLRELDDGVNSAGNKLVQEFQASVDSPITTIATDLRKYLDISVEEQISWGSIEESLENWRERLSDFGVSVFKDAFRDPDYFGFSLYDDEFPIIYVNNSSRKTRQIFTIFHELAHLIFHTSGIDFKDENFIQKLSVGGKTIEIMCNKLASAFLVPDNEFESIARDLEKDRHSAAELANQFGVSREVIYRKFLNSNWISSKEYKSAVHQWNEQIGAQNPAGGDYYNNQMSYLGVPFIKMAFDRYYKNRIDRNQLADYLNVKPKSVDGIEERFLKRGIVQ